jgi:aminoglycoside/choline kinase family phosphotransferase
MSRAAIIDRFLADAGYRRARRLPLAADASYRRYIRLLDGPHPAVLMDAPPPAGAIGANPCDSFLRVATHLASLGLSVPAIYAAEPGAGLVLLEDFGDGVYPTVLDGENQELLFDCAIDALVTVQTSPPPTGLPSWGSAEMIRAVGASLYEWWWPACFGRPAPGAARADIEAALATMLRPLDLAPRVLTHRDFFVGNLIWLPHRKGTRRVGLIDFQDAALGHPAYDLVALVEDARRDIPPALAARAVARYRAARPDPEGEEGGDPGGDAGGAAFNEALAICAAQRHLRVAAQWVRLARRDGKPHYLAHGPRTWQLLDQALGRPGCKPLRQALDRWIPPRWRANPPPRADNAA